MWTTHMFQRNIEQIPFSLSFNFSDCGDWVRVSVVICIYILPQPLMYMYMYILLILMICYPLYIFYSHRHATKWSDTSKTNQKYHWKNWPQIRGICSPHRRAFLKSSIIHTNTIWTRCRHRRCHQPVPVHHGIRRWAVRSWWKRRAAKWTTKTIPIAVKRN